MLTDYNNCHNIPVRSSIKQGCPVSVLIFVIAIEMLCV